MKSGALLILALTLLAAVGLQFTSLDAAREDAIVIDLQRLLPQDAHGWRFEDLPLSPTETGQSDVERRLNYDDFVFRRYERGGKHVSVYIGYWGPGRMDTRLVASHTPDRCWTENGWTCVDRVFASPLVIPGLTTKPVQERAYTYADHPEVEYVYFWHLVGDDVYDFGERLNTYPHPAKFLRDFVKQLRSGKAEQFFIRISSDLPTSQLKEEPLFQEILESMRELGIEAPAAA